MVACHVCDPDVRFVTRRPRSLLPLLPHRPPIRPGPCAARSLMRVAILSDLHIEFEPFEPPPQVRQADLVILAGDIHNGIAALDWARRTFPGQRLVQVAGNHEFFGGCWQTTLSQLRHAAAALDIHLLENDAVEIDGVQFLGATLWTDFRLFEVPGRPLQMSADEAKPLLQRRMVDFSLIRFRGGNEGGARTAAGRVRATSASSRPTTALRSIAAAANGLSASWRRLSQARASSSPITCRAGGRSRRPSCGRCRTPPSPATSMPCSGRWRSGCTATPIIHSTIAPVRPA